MYTKLQKIEEGFTIVETLIVLAIAALILIIVLIAVPDLQRSARNTDIYHDAQNVASAVETYEGNNQGAIPEAATGPQQGPTIKIGVAPAATATAAVQGSTYVNITTTLPSSVGWANSPTTGTDVGVGYIVVVSGADCNGSSPGAATGTTLTPNPDSRAVAVYYPIELSSGGNVGCIQE